MTLKQIIDIADAAYPDGFVGLYAKQPKKNHGDTLAKFIYLELKDTYAPELSGPRQLSLARRAIANAIDELQTVLDALGRRPKHHELGR